MRWSERRTAVRCTFEMSSTPSFRAAVERNFAESNSERKKSRRHPGEVKRRRTANFQEQPPVGSAIYR